MILDIIAGDITHPDNRDDIIIGMNVKLSEVTSIGLPFVNQIDLKHALVPGSVLSFPFRDGRFLHMLICHELGVGGWEGAAEHVRYGLDYLRHTEPLRSYSIVKIGSGKIGKRDGANVSEMIGAIANSNLPVVLYVYDAAAEATLQRVIEMPPLRASRAWHPVYGEERVH